MSDREALLAAICAHPDEDTPRLVYADWLEEHGQGVRAAHLRAQIEHHRLAAADTALGAVGAYLEREIDIGLEQIGGQERIDWGTVDAVLAARLAARARANAPGEYKITGERVPRVRGVAYECIARGFYDTVTVSGAGAFLKHARAIFRAAPITNVNFLKLTGSQAAEFVAAGDLARVRELCVTGVDPDAIRALGTHRDAAGVRWLRIIDRVGTAAALEALAQGTNWTGLADLSVLAPVWAEPPAEQLADLFARPQFRNLRALEVSNLNLGADGVRAIIGHMPELRALRLAKSSITGAGAELLAATKKLRHLRALDLTRCDLGGFDPAPLIIARNLPKLTVLLLGRNALRGPGAKALARPGRGPGLRVLALDNSFLTSSGTEALARCPALRGLWGLTLADGEVTDDHLERFTRRAAFERLTFLHLGSNHLTARGAQALAAWPGAVNLQWLDLRANSIGDAGARALTASPYLVGLKYLHATGGGTARLKKRFKTAFV
jgi:uncharacterized protein (TIGR02996 family)